MSIATSNMERLDEGTELAERIRIMRPQLMHIRVDTLCLQDLRSEGQSGQRSSKTLGQLRQSTAHLDFKLRMIANMDARFQCSCHGVCA